MVFRGATTATPLMGSRRTSWGVDLASPEPEPKDLLLWSGACQFSLSLESHSRFIHSDVHCRGTETHSADNWGSAALTGSPATTALIRVRHLAWEWPYRETGAQLGSVLKDALTKCQLFPRNLFIIYSSNPESIKCSSSLASCDLNGLGCLLCMPKRRWASPYYLVYSAEKPESPCPAFQQSLFP